MSFSITKKVSVGFALALILLGIIDVASYRSTAALVENSKQKEHTERVLEQLNSLLAKVTDAETGERGYIVTGDSVYLEPFNAAAEVVDHEIRNLGILITDNPSQVSRLASLKRLVADKIALIREKIELRRVLGFEAARRAVASGEGKSAMDSVRVLIRDMVNEERVLLQQRDARARASARNTIFIIGFGSLLAFLTVALAIYFISRDLTEKKHAEEALRQQAHIIDHIHDSVVSTDLDGCVTSWNKGAERMFGYSAKEAVGRHISFVYREEQHHFLEHEVIEPLKNKGSHEVEVTMRKKSGEEFFVHLSLSLIRDRDGTVTGMIGYSMDITEQARAKRALQIRARQQEAVAELGQQALTGRDLPGLMEIAVGVVAETLGVEYCKVLEVLPEKKALLLRAGVGWMEGRVGEAIVESSADSQAGFTLLSEHPVLVDDLRTESRFQAPKLLTEHGVVSGLSVVIHGTSGPFGVLGAHTSNPRAFMQDDAHFLQSVANVLSAAVERERGQAAQARLAAILEATTDFVGFADGNGRTLYVNLAGRRMVGIGAEEDVTRSALTDYCPEWTKKILVNTGIPTAVREGVWSGEAALLSRGGREIPISQVLLAHKDAEGRVEILSTIARDITARKQAEAEIRAYQSQLRSLASELSLAEERERRRIAVALHDHIAQPLALSKIKLGSLQHAEGNGDFVRKVSELRQVLDETIEQTRSLSFELSPPILYELGFEAAVAWLAERTKDEHGLEVRVEDDQQPKQLDEGLSVLLFTAVRELLVNVVKHARARTAKIEIRKENSSIRVDVEDDGIGFEAFGDGMRVGRKGGFGLFSIRERLNHMGGSFVVHSEPGKGAHMSLVAPLKPDRGPIEEA